MTPPRARDGFDPGSLAAPIRPEKWLGGLGLVVEVEDHPVPVRLADPELHRGALLELAQELDRLVEPQRQGRPALGELANRDLRGCADLLRRVLEANQLRKVTERADVDLDQPLEKLLARARTAALGCWVGAVRGPRLDLDQLRDLLHPAPDRNRVLERLHPDPRRLATRLSVQLVEPHRHRLQRRQAAVVAVVCLPPRPPPGVALALASQEHLREAMQLPLQLPDPRITGPDGRIDFCAPVAEESPPEATHGRQARAAVGRNYVSSGAKANRRSVRLRRHGGRLLTHAPRG